MITVQLHRTGVVLVAIGAAILGVLIFAGGYLAGMRRGSVALSRPAMPSRPKLTMPAPAATPPAIATPGKPKPQQLAIRAGLFTTSEDATAFAQQLTARNMKATVATTTTSSGAMLYSVSVGQFDNRRDAAAAVEALKRELGIDGAIVSVQPEPLKP